MQSNRTHAFWPAGARLVISISMQMEAGAQPESGAESPLPKIGPSVLCQKSCNVAKLSNRSKRIRCMIPSLSPPVGVR